jgi:hypothetical protein
MTDLVPGVTLVTEEVEPSVLRIVSDGIRDLPQPSSGSISSRRGPAASWSNVVAGADGSVWVFWPDESYRLGDPATHPPVPENAKARRENRAVDRDGNLWAIVDGALRSFDGRAWTIRRENVGSFDVQLDGTVWSGSDGDPSLDAGERPVDGLARLEGERWTAVRYELTGDDGWFMVSPVPHPGPVHMLTVRQGVLWTWDVEPGPDGNVGGTEARQASDIGGVLAVDFGARGDYWVYQAVTLPVPGSVLPDDGGQTRVMPFLTHVEGGSMVVYGEEQGVPRLGGIPAEGGPVRLLKTAPDGSVWLTPGTGEVDCQGIARFDGDVWTRFLSGRCIFALDIGPDGTVWAHAGTSGVPPPTRDTFAIRPSPPATD